MDCFRRRFTGIILGTAMKTKLLLFLLLFTTRAYCGEWNWQHPLPQGNTVRSTAFPTSFYGYAVGDYGTILVTYDRGSSWELQYEGVTDNLLDIDAIDSVTAWIAGDNGTILFTSDGGGTWQQQSTPTGNGLNGIFFFNKVFGWACGDSRTILHTTNGGASWTAQTPMAVPPTVGFNGLHFVSSLEGWVVGSGGVILHTTDGGTSWSQQYSTGITGQRVRFVSPTKGFVAGESGALYYTTDAGATWHSQPSGTSYGLNDIAFASSSEYWISGDNGTVLHSTNAGGTWTASSLGTYASLNGFAGMSDLLVAVGENGVVARKDGALPWSFLNRGDNRSVNWLSYSDEGHGFGVGQYGLILRTTDGGSTWVDIVNGLSLDSFYGAAMGDRNNVWIVGDLGVLLHSSDGGLSWTQQTTNTTNTLLSISFVGNLKGWAVGDAGECLTTTNGGQTWSHQSVGTSAILFGIFFFDQLNGWITGDGGTILHTTNGGSSWAVQTSNTATALFSATFISSETGYCAGSGGVLLKTTNGGSTWSPLSSGTASNLYVVSGPAGHSLWAVGDAGLVLYSTDSGTTWNPQFAKTGFDLFGLHAFSDTSAALCGDNGTIMKYPSANPPLVAMVQITNPQAAEALRTGTPYDISWISTLVERVSISFSSDSGHSWTVLASDTPSVPSVLHWTTPLTPSKSCLMTITSTADSSITTTGFFTLSPSIYPAQAGWNMLSIPALPSDPAPAVNFPQALTPAYAFTESYVAVDSVKEGVGYWVKFRASRMLPIFGTPLLADTLGCTAGWNLVGSISSPVPATSLKMLPAGGVVGFAYAYFAGRGYLPADTLFPGRGYWIKLSQEGQLIVGPGSPSGTAQSSTVLLENMSSLTFTDAAGQTGVLYLSPHATEAAHSERFLLPPKPPQGSFDVRFSTQKFAEVFGESSPALTIETQGIRFPLRIRLGQLRQDGISCEVSRADGKGAFVLSSAAPEIRLSSGPADSLVIRMIGKHETVSSFQISEAYPNPFNPSTAILLSLPSKTQVTAKIYDILGRSVRTLADQTFGPGTVRLEWDGKDNHGGEAVSGIYFIKITTSQNGGHASSLVRKIARLR